MSRGFGWLQREILASLVDARTPADLLLGVPAGAYSVAETLRVLKARHKHTPTPISDPSYSRAIRTLIARGVLIECSRTGTPDWASPVWTDQGRRRRYVCRREAPRDADDDPDAW